MYLWTVCFTNILQGNRTIFFYRKKEIARQINISVSVSKLIFPLARRDEDMPITRRAFDVQLELNLSI